MKLDLHFKTWVKNSVSEFAKKKKNLLKLNAHLHV